jgi:two-component system, NarL family, response regulator NreC
MAKTGNIKVLIIDNCPLFSLGLSTLIEKTQKFDIIGAAENCANALKTAEKEKPNLVLMDINLGKENGLELIPKLKMINPEITILIISIQDERFYAERVLRLGAKGYVLKTESADTIRSAINTVLDNKVYLSETERDRIFQAMTEESKLGVKDWITSIQLLSNRELQIFSFLAKGLGTIEIAARLNLSTKTIDTHKEHIKIKLQCNSVQELRQKAIEWSNYAENL